LRPFPGTTTKYWNAPAGGVPGLTEASPNWNPQAELVQERPVIVPAAWPQYTVESLV
jgi:hypothetical protein